VLDKPEIPDERVIACLRDAFDLRIGEMAFLPLGADMNTAAYRAVAHDGCAYFAKLRLRAFDELSAVVPRQLSDAGIAQVLAPRLTRSGQPFASFGDGALIVYPFVDAVTGHDVALTVEQWRELGRATRAVHATNVTDLAGRIARETFTAITRNSVFDLLLRLDHVTTHDEMIADATALLRARRNEIRALIDRAEALARTLRERSLPFVLCHSDLHAYNLLIDRDGALYIVDWDQPMLAPKERDLMFLGGTQSFVGYTPEQEQRFFMQGYGDTPPADRTALAYFRCGRAIKDFADAYHEISSPQLSRRDRSRSLDYLSSMFRPGGALDLARSTSDRG